MEQKKILWIILSVSLFVLVLFGIALFLYSPSRMQNTAQSGGELIPYEGIIQNQTSVDPDKWVRDPESVASLDKTQSPAIENIINLAIVSNDNQGNAKDGSKDIDVSGLTSDETEESIEPEEQLPQEIAEEIGIAPVNTAKKDNASAKVTKTVKPNMIISKPVQKHKNTDIAKAVPKKEQKQTSKKSFEQKKIENAQTKLKAQRIFWVQTASLASRLNAERARDTLATQHMKVEVFTKDTSTGLTHRVRVGPFTNNTEATYWLKNIQKMKGFETSYITEELLK